MHERFGAFQRASVQVLSTPDYSLHLGGGLDELFSAPDTGFGTARQITLSDQPELRIDPTALMSTGPIGSVANPVTGAMVYNAEAAAGYGSFFLQGEYNIYQVSRTGLAKAKFSGGYAMATYVLTGERRAYNRATGAYGSITPRAPFSLGGGIGAWELAARVSYTDLVDHYVYGTALAAQPDAVNGGIQTNYTFGVTWYLNSYLRMMFNYVHSDLKKINGAALPGAALGAPIGGQLDALAARIQFAF